MFTSLCPAELSDQPSQEPAALRCFLLLRHRSLEAVLWQSLPCFGRNAKLAMLRGGTPVARCTLQALCPESSPPASTCRALPSSSSASAWTLSVPIMRAAEHICVLLLRQLCSLVDVACSCPVAGLFFWTQRKACHKWLDPSSEHPLPRIFTSFATSFSATMHAAEHMDGVQKGRFCSCAPDCVQLNWLTNPASYKRRSKKKGRRRHVAFYF